MNLITISASTLIQQSDFLIEGHYIKKRIAVNTVPNKLPLAKLSVLESTDVIIFQSKNAVRHLDYPLRQSDAEIFCVGPYTGHFLKSKYGLDSKCPRKNFSAYGLLSELKLNDLKDKNICLIKGDDGIDTISKTLKANNKVNIINTYKRSVIKDFIVESDFSNEEVNVFISMSKTSMDALKSIISQFHNKYRVVFIVPSERFIEESSDNGIYKYYVWDQAASLDGLRVILRDIK